MTDEQYLKRLGERIREFRKEKMSQEELATRIGTHHPQIGRLERGETNCTIIILRKIANELGVSVSELIKI